MSDIRESHEVRIEHVQADMRESVARARKLVARSRGLFRDPLGERCGDETTERLIEGNAAAQRAR
jgi:hypothetical protein